MAKVIFVLQRRAGLTREQALAQWSGTQHVTIVGKLPGLTRYIQNHAGSAPAEPVCDGIGELWFPTDDLMNEALNSPEMAAAVEDAKRFLDMERTGMILVQEKILIGLSAHTPTTRGYMRAIGMSGDHADGHLAHLSGLAGLDAADTTTLIARRGTPRCRCHPGLDNAPSTQINLDPGSQRLDHTPTDIHPDRRLGGFGTGLPPGVAAALGDRPVHTIPQGSWQTEPEAAGARTSSWLIPALLPGAASSLPGAAAPRAARQESLAPVWC